MSNRKERRRAAAVRRSAKPMTRTDRGILISRVGVVIAAAAAAVALYAVFRGF